MSATPSKVTVVQAGSVLFDTPRTLTYLADLTRDAAAQGAHLVVFPEAFVGGYPKGLDFDGRLLGIHRKLMPTALERLI